jgi:hypothetical protein
MLLETDKSFLVLFFKKELLLLLNLLFLPAMPFVARNCRSRIAHFFGWIAVVLALAAQICSGGLAPADRSRTAALNAAMVLCLGGNHAKKDGPAPIHHHLPNLAIAAEGHHFGQLPALVAGKGAVPPPTAILTFWTGLPAARAPPARFAAASYPTGPPSA